MAVAGDFGASRAAATGRVAVVIPALDEEHAIADVVRGIPRDVASRVIVADGGRAEICPANN